MKSDFDPYLDWLKIPALHRPPNHYELLGLSPGVSDSGRIESAALERIAFVRRYQVGAHEQIAQRLLGELSAAYVCLSDPQRKRQYDDSLRTAKTVDTDHQATFAEEIRPNGNLGLPSDSATNVAPSVLSPGGMPSKRAVTSEVTQLQPRRGAARRPAQPAPLDQAPARTVWAVEAGSSSLKAMRLKLSEATGVVAVLAAERFEYAQPVAADDDQADNLVGQAIERWRMKYAIDDEAVAVVVPTSAAMIRTIRLPPMPEHRVAQAVRLEALSQFPIPLQELSWDFYVAPAAEGDGARHVVLIAERRDRLRRELAHWLERSIQPDLVQIKAVAWFNIARRELLGHLPETPQHDATESLAIMSLTAEGGELLVTNGYHFWHHELPIGGDHFTDALADGFRIPVAKAEQRKRSLAGSPDMNESLKLLKPAFDELLNQVQRGLSVYAVAYPSSRVTRGIVSGSGMKLPGLQRLLAERLRLDIQAIDSWRLAYDLSGSADLADAEAFDRFAACYAAGCQALGKATANIQIVPRDLAKARRRRRRNAQSVVIAAPLMAAAILLLLAYGILTMGRPGPSSDAERLLIEPVNEATATSPTADDSTDEDAPMAPAEAPPPKLQIVEATPADPEEGDTLLVTLSWQSEYPGRVTVRYRQNPQDLWQTTNSDEVRLRNLKPGKLDASFVVSDARGRQSSQVNRQWQVKPKPSSTTASSAQPNRPPTVDVLKVQPSAPVAGETVMIELSSSDPDGDRIQYQYRRPGDMPWQAAPKGMVSVEKVSAGTLALEFRVIDQRLLESEVIQKTIQVEPNPLADWQLIATLGPEAGKINYVNFRNQGALILGLDNGRCEFWSISEAAMQKAFPGSQGSVSQAVMSDGRNLLTLYSGGTIESWIVSTEKSRGFQNPNDAPSPFGFGSVGIKAATPLPSTSGASTVQAKLAPNGQRVVYPVGDKRLQWYQIPAIGRMKPHRQAKDLHAAITAIEFSRDSRYLAVALADGQIVVFDNSNLHTLSQFDSGGVMTSLAFCVSDGLLACSGSEEPISVWQFEDERQLLSIKPVPSLVQCLAFPASSANLLAGGTLDGQVLFWRVADGRLLRSLKVQQGPVTCLASLPGGDLVAAGGPLGKAFVFGPNSN